MARVRARVEKGGHPISEEKIRERYDSSRVNLIRLLGALTELMIFDNSEEADPATGRHTEPQLILHMASQRIVEVCDLRAVPEWAKPIVTTALPTDARAPNR